MTTLHKAILMGPPRQMRIYNDRSLVRWFSLALAQEVCPISTTSHHT